MLKIKIESLDEINKYCIICIDKMSLKKHLFYNITRNKVIGFEDPQSYKSSINCIKCSSFYDWGYLSIMETTIVIFFSSSTMNTSDLLQIIKETIQKLRTIGLQVVGLTTDMGSNFYKVSQLLNISVTNSYFEIDEDKIYILYFLFTSPIKSN